MSLPRKIYLVGSLRNPEVPKFGSRLRALGHNVFDDWYAAGERADDAWREYEIARGRSYRDAINGHAAQNVLAFDKRHLDWATTIILLLPAGKSGHLEIGRAIGEKKETHIVLDADYDRWDVMYGLATDVWKSADELIENWS